MRAIVLLAYNALRLLTFPLRVLWRRRVFRNAPRWIALNLRGRIDELPRLPSRWARLLAGLRPQHRSIAEIRRLCDRVGADPRAEGILLRLEHLDTGYPVLTSLRQEIAQLRDRGKKVVCYLPLGGDQRELFVASAADRVVTMPHAGFSALGPAAARTYLAPLLERIGVEVAATSEGRFKTAAEPFVRESMSEPEREQLTAIVRTVERAWLAALGARPSLGRAGAERLFQLGLFGGGQAHELGVVDSCRYEDELAQELGLQAGEQPIAPERYLRRAGAPLFVPLRPPPKIALLRLVGTISERAATGGIDLHGTSAAIRRLLATEQVAGVIVHIDSPGGSALVSELLHRELERLAARKPVVTWMGNVAASGGYYLASATRAIVAQPTTLTGSIGVVSLRPIAEGLLAHLRVRRELVSVTPHADLHGWSHAPSAAEEALQRSETRRYYDRFLAVVAAGRGRPRDEIAALAEGRVWSGADAHACGLVDALGGYHEARERLDALLGTAASAVDREPLLVVPPRRSVPPPPPLGADALAAALLAPQGWLRLPEPLRELAALLYSGERVFAYAHTLPQVI